MGKLKILFGVIFLLSISGRLSAQTNEADSLVRLGDSLHLSYDFGQAIEIYDEARAVLEDTLMYPYDTLKLLSVQDKILLSENGRSMSSYVYCPTVIARHKFSIDDFFLYYPLPDRSWRTLPNQLDTAAVSGLSRAVYVPEGSERIYYTAEDGDGVRNIYMTEYQDTVWTCPALLNEQITSFSDEIYPMLSSDGKTIYFSSKGLYGVGGFDIYMSEWSEKDNDWSVPVNMGFPYSSPADDFLFMNTDDGLHTIFASNRGCSPDSVYVYVLEFDNMPIRREIGNPADLAEIARLDPVDLSETLGETEVEASMPENVDIERYMSQMVEVRALRDSLSLYNIALDDARNRFALSNDYAERLKLTDDILRREARIQLLQEAEAKVVEKLQQIEMEFLFSGVVIDLDLMMKEADREIVGEATRYTFTKMSPGDPLSLRIREPEKAFDYSFMVLEEGQFARDNTLPEGIVYQIQMFSSGEKADVGDLRGLSPVFERQTSTGRYLYSVGLFNTYNDVLSKLNTVKRLGFKNAFIVAFIDGEEVFVAEARTEEMKRKQE